MVYSRQVKNAKVRSQKSGGKRPNSYLQLNFGLYSGSHTKFARIAPFSSRRDIPAERLYKVWWVGKKGVATRILYELS